MSLGCNGCGARKRVLSGQASHCMRFDILWLRTYPNQGVRFPHSHCTYLDMQRSINTYSRHFVVNLLLFLARYLQLSACSRKLLSLKISLFHVRSPKPRPGSRLEYRQELYLESWSMFHENKRCGEVGFLHRSIAGFDPSHIRIISNYRTDI